MSDRYTYRVTWSPEDGEFVGLCLEFPLLSWLAESPDEAFSGIRALVRDIVADLATIGETPPAPLAERRYSGRFVVRLPPEVHRRLTIEAAEAGVSLNRLVSTRLATGAEARGRPSGR